MTTHFQKYLLFISIMPKFFKFCNHLIINSKKSTMILLSYFQLFSIYILLLVSKNWTIFCLFLRHLFFKNILPCFPPNPKMTWIFFNLESAFTWGTSLSNVSYKDEEVKEANLNGTPEVLILFKRWQKLIGAKKLRNKSKDDQIKHL